jgi:hypothetical protein
MSVRDEQGQNDHAELMELRAKHDAVCALFGKIVSAWHGSETGQIDGAPIEEGQRLLGWELAVYVDSEDEEAVVAFSPEDAAAIYREMYGEDLAHDGEPAVWEALPNEEALTLRDENGNTSTRTCAEWVQDGRGHIGSTSA